MGIYAYAPLVMVRTNVEYSYPNWANIVGWIIAASSCICIPIVAVYNLFKAEGTFLEVFSFKYFK